MKDNLDSRMCVVCIMCLSNHLRVIVQNGQIYQEIWYKTPEKVFFQPLPEIERLPGKLKLSFWRNRNDEKFSDVTLACEDGAQIETHKVILAASSPVPFSTSSWGETSTHTHWYTWVGSKQMNLWPSLIFFTLARKLSIMVSTDVQQLDEEVKSMMEMSENVLTIGNSTRRARIC